MKIKAYVVTDPAGVVWNGRIVVAGGAITAAADGRIQSYLHFRQVREVETAAEAAPAAAEGAPDLEQGQSAPLAEGAFGGEVVAPQETPRGRKR